MLTDAAIVATVREAGRDAALAALLPVYRRRVHSLAWSIVRNSALADDIAQEVFIRVWRALPSYDERARFSTWLYAITRNTAISALRKRRQDHATLSDAATLLEAEQVLLQHEPGDAAGVGELATSRLWRAVGALPDNQQQVVALFYLQDRSYEEVAELLAMPLGTVKTLLHRARQRLASLLQQQQDESGDNQ